MLLYLSRDSIGFSIQLIRVSKVRKIANEKRKLSYTEAEMSFGRYFRHSLLHKLSKWQVFKDKNNVMIRFSGMPFFSVVAPQVVMGDKVWITTWQHIESHSPI